MENENMGQISLALIVTSLISVFLIFKYSFLFIFIGISIYFLTLLIKTCVDKNDNRYGLVTFFKHLIFTLPLLMISKNAWSVYKIDVDKETLKNDNNLYGIYIVLYIIILLQSLTAYYFTKNFLKNKAGGDFFDNSGIYSVLYFVFIFAFSLFVFPLAYELKHAGKNGTDDKEINYLAFKLK